MVHVACISATLMHFAELSYQKGPSPTLFSLVPWLAECVIVAFGAMYIVPTSHRNFLLQAERYPDNLFPVGADNNTIRVLCC